MKATRLFLFALITLFCALLQPRTASAQYFTYTQSFNTGANGFGFGSAYSNGFEWYSNYNCTGSGGAMMSSLSPSLYLTPVLWFPYVGYSAGGPTTVTFSFKIGGAYSTPVPNNAGTFVVQYQTSAGWVTAFTANTSNIQSTWSCQTLTTPAFTPPVGPLNLRIVATNTNNYTYTLAFDDIIVQEASGPACTGMPAGGTTVSTASPACPNTPFFLRVAPAITNAGLAFQWQSSPNGSSWTDITGATAYELQTSLTANTYYRRKVTCGANVAYSSALLVNVNTNYIACACSSGANDNSGTDITNFNLGTINNTSSCFSLAGTQGTAIGAAAQYSNWTTSTVPVPSLPQGTTQPFTLSIVYCGNNVYAYTDSKIFIDFNADSDFDDPGESVFSSPAPLPSQNYAGPTESGTIAIPANAPPGQRLLRIINASGSNQGFGSCGTYNGGETEDYLINIVAGPDCAGTPAAAVVTGPASVCPTTAFTLNASNFALNGMTGFSYQWQSSPASANTWTDIAGATAAPSYANVLNPVASATIPLGQQVATDYRLKVTCTNSNLSSYSNALSVGMSAPTACYCASGITNTNTCNRSISNVSTVGLFTNLTNASACAATGYTYYNTVNPAAHHQGYPVTFNLTSAGGPTWWNIYVDYDNNGSFSAGELVYQNNNTANATTVSASFTIPVSVATGMKRMRIQAGDNTTPNTGNPCAPLAGETEDYGFNVITQPACTGTPTAGTISMSGSNTFCGTAASRTFTATGYTDNLTGITLIWQVSPNNNTANFVDMGATGPVLNSPANTYNDDRYYRLKVTCTNSGLSVYSNAIPLYTSYASVAISPGQGATGMCQGETMQLLASGVGTFVWSSDPTDPTLSCTACTNPVASPTVTTDYYVTATNSQGCTATGVTTVFVAHRPIVNTVTASTLTPCQGQFVNLSGTAYQPATYSGFAGPFAPQHWTLTQSASNGTLDVSASTDSLVFISSDSTGISPLPGTDTWSIPMTYAGSVTFNWYYSTAQNAAADYPMYSVTGSTYQLLPGFNLNGPSVQSGTATIAVVPGTIFRLRNLSTTNTGGSDTVIITAFVSPGGYAGSYMRWFNAPTGGTPIAMNVIPAGPNPITYYGEAYTGSGCKSLLRKPVTVTPGLVRRWTGGTSTNWLTSSNWCGPIPTDTSDVVIPGAHTVTYMPQLAGLGRARNIRLDSNATVTVANLGTLNVYGNITGPGSINASAGTVNFAGTGPQAITPGFTVKTLTINSASTKTLSGNVLVNTTLNLTNGILDIGSDTLTLAPAAVINLGTNGSYIRTSAPGGRLRRTVSTTPVLFPVGNATYNPATLTNAGTADIFTVGLRDTVQVFGTTGLPVDTATFRMVNRTWDVEELVPGGSNVTMKLQWNAGQQNTPSFDYSHMFVSHFTGGQWTYDPDYTAPLSAPAAGGPTGGLYSATRNDITSFSPFSVASSLGASGTPLPVTLVNLQARNAGSRNRISWAAASEAAMSSYIIERSEDGIRFSAMEEIAARNKAGDYESFDNSPATGFTYYRLKMKEASGDFHYSGTVRAYMAAVGAIAITVQPNPVNDVVTVRIDGTTDGDVQLLDLTGRSIVSAAIKDGQVQIDMRHLAAGPYFLRYTNSIISRTIKISKL